MKQAKWILAILTAAVLCIIGAAAMADGEDTHLALRVVNGMPTQITPDQGTAYTQYSGSYYYKIYIDNIPEDGKAVQMGFGGVEDSEPTDPWYQPVSRLRQDDGGLFMMRLPEPPPPGSNATSTSNAIFVRMYESEAWQKAALVYDLTKTNGSEVTITNTSGPVLNEDYTITWDGEDDADAFIVYWQLPNGDQPGFFVPGSEESLQLFSLGDRYGDMGELVRYAGTYEIWVETYAHNAVGTSARKTWTVTVPENNYPQIHLTSSEADEDGVITVPVYGEVTVNVTADDDVIRNHIEEFHFVNGQWTDGINPWDLWQNGYVQMKWRPNHESTTDQYYTIYAYARIPQEGQPDRIVRSNALTIKVTMTKTIAGDVTFTADGTATGTPAAINVAKDDALTLHVNNIGADYYGAEISEEGNHLDHIAESRWVTPAPGSTTEVRMPVFECEVGKVYEVKVYALTCGAPMKYSKQTVKVRVTERATDAPVILEIAGDTDEEGVYHFDTDERIRIYSYFENPGYALDEEYSWIQVTAYNDYKDYCFWNENGDGFYYWTDAMRIGNPGDYIVEACIMTNDGDWEQEAHMVEGTLVSAQIHVEASHNAQLDAPNVTLTPVKSTTGDIVKLTVGTVEHAERYFYWIHQTNDDRDRMSGDMTTAGQVGIDTGLLGPGVYAVEVSAHGRGYEENFTRNYFVVFGNEDADKSYDGYYFSTNARQSAEDAGADFIADVGEEVRFIGFMPGSGEINLGKKKADWTETHGFDYCEAPGVCCYHRFDEEGLYTIYMGGVVDGSWTEYPVCTILVSAYGNLDAPAVTINGTAFADQAVIAPDANNPSKLTLAFNKVANADYYYVEIREDGDGWEFYHKDVNQEEIDGNTVSLEIDHDAIRPGYVYRVKVEASAEGLNWGRTEGCFLLASGQQSAGITLTANGYDGSDGEPLDILSSSNIHVQVMWPEGEGTLGRPTAVRVLNNNRWDYMWSPDDNCERDWGFGDGSLFLYAEATWDDRYDFEQLDRDGWRDFDWDRDVNWTGKSNVIKLNLTSPYGTMIAPTFTLANNQLAWGEDLVVSIADEGPSVVDQSASGGRRVVEDGWFFFSIEIDCGDHWDRYDQFGIDLRPGENTIPTYWIMPGSRCRIEIGADGEGYSGRSNRVEFTVGEREQSEEPTRMFTVNGVSGTGEQPGALTVSTRTELRLEAYQDGAEWYNVEITEEGNDDWDDGRGENRIGMLLDKWQSDRTGVFTLTAYAYGHHRDEDGNIIRIDGMEEWRDEIGTVVVTYEAPYGKLGELTATMMDRAYVGEAVELTFDAVANAPDETEYSYWIHEDTDRSWRAGESRQGAGTMTIDTRGMQPDVYWVEMDAMAAGYDQSHATLHMALLDPDDTDMSNKDMGYYFTTSMQQPLVTEGEDEPETDFVVQAGEDFRFTFYMPGAEQVNLSQKKNDWRDSNGFAGCDGPGVSQWHSFDSRGEYTIYGSYQADGRWSDEIELCTVTVTAEGSLRMPWVETPMVVNAGEDVHITYHLDENINSYSYWISFEDDGRNICGDWKNADDMRADEISEDNTYDFVIPADRLEGNRVYHIYLDVNKPGWEQGHEDRTLFVLGEPDSEAVTLTVNDRNGQTPQAIAIGDRYPVTVSAPGAETLHIWWDESVSYIDISGDYFEQEFCLDWKGGEWAPDFCTFHAIATYGGSWLKVSETIDIPISNRETAEEATAPTLSLVNDGTIYRGDFLLAEVGEIEDEGVYEYNAYITDEYGNWIYRNDREDAGVIALPTNDLEPGQTYRLSAYARVMGKYRTDSPAIEFTVSEPTKNLFVTDKTTVAVMEKMIVSIVAPGANRVRYNGGYGNWDEFDGDNWYGDWISWDMSADNITIEAEALFPGDDDWTPIGGIPITITADGDLDQPQFLDLRDIIGEGEALDIAVSEIDGAEEYEIQMNRLDGQDRLGFRSNTPNFHIPAGRLYSGGYQVEIWAMAYGKNAGHNETRLYVERFRPEIGIDSVVSNTEDLDITVPVVGGEDYHLMIHYVPNDNFEESILYRENLGASDADENGVLHFLVPAGRLRDNTTHWVDLSINGENFYAENSKAFLVRNGKTDGNITVTVNGESDEAYVMIHDNFQVSVNAPGAKAIIVHCGDRWQAYAGSTVTDAEFNENQICRETLYAQAYYGNETDLPGDPWDNRWLDLEWGLPSHTVDVNFYAIGQVGEPWGRFPNIIRQGEILVISDIYPGENGNETHANINRNEPWQEEDRVFGDDWRGWDEHSKTIYLPTDDLEPNRDYWIMLDNSGVGMEGNRMWWRVSVFPKEEEPENGVAIHSLKKAQAGTTVPVSVSAKGAVEVGFGLDLAADEKGDVTKYQFRGEEGTDSFFTNGGWFNIDETGEHTLTAYAVLPDSDELVYTDTTITICDPLWFDMTAMPGYFTEGQDNASVTVKLPANAQRMFIQIHAEGEDYRQDIYESRERDETEDTTIEIPAEYLTAGNRIRVDFQAQADGFEDTGDGITIPVVAGTQSNLVNLRLVNNREDQTALDLGDIWANQEMVFLATPTNGNEITAIRFFNGHDWWENGEAITRDNHGDWYMNDGSVFFQERYNVDNNRAVTAFAEVRVNGSETWQRTNEIRFTVQNHGMVGWYDFADGSDITVPRGTVITVEFTEAENATHYWVDAFDENDRGWDPWSWDDGTTVRINTNRLPAGVYVLRGRAGGGDGSGLLWRESDGYVKLTITENVPQMADPTFTTPRGLTTIEDEAFAGIAARVIMITRDVENIGDHAFSGAPVEQVGFLNADTDIHWDAFAGCGELTVFGIPGGNVERWAEEHNFAFYPLVFQE